HKSPTADERRVRRITATPASIKVRSASALVERVGTETDSIGGPVPCRPKNMLSKSRLNTTGDATAITSKSTLWAPGGATTSSPWRKYHVPRFALDPFSGGVWASSRLPSPPQDGSGRKRI